MKPISSKVVVCLVAFSFLAAVGAAEGESYWQPGTGVRVGDVYFHVVSVAPNSEALFRVAERLDAPGVEEHPDCYRVSRTFYHVESCPVVQEHFRRHAGSAASSAPEAMPAAPSSGSHPINYLQGSYERPQQPFWGYTGLWFTPWFGSGIYSGGRLPYTRPGFGRGGRPGFRPGLGPGSRPGVRPGHGPGFGPGFGPGRSGGFYGGGRFHARGFRGGFGFYGGVFR